MMKIAVATGGRLEYDDVGRGRLIVLLHAFPLSHAMWRPQVQALASAYRIITPDLRGFGGSDGFNGSPSIERMSADIDALLTALHVDTRVVLGGLSMGGYVALAFAHKFANRLRALILADTRAEADTDEGKVSREQLIAFAQSHQASDVIDQMMPRMVSEATRTQHPEVVEEIRRIASTQKVSGIISALRAMRDRPDATPWLGDVTVPTLVMVGSEDALTPPAMSDKLAAGIPRFRRASIAGAGHMSNLEQPELFNQALRSFLLSLP
jgi:pimeloyl-ACP methyl ester carboxylesterase